MLNKIRFIEPANHTLYRKSFSNHFVYNKYIKNPSTGLNILTTIVAQEIADTMMYSEAIATIDFDDVYDADIIFISINTYNATRGYTLAKNIRDKSNALIVFGGLHASLNYSETINYCDYVLIGDGDTLIVDFIKMISNQTKVTFPGVVYWLDDEVCHSGQPQQPDNIDVIPNRELVYNYSHQAKRLNTLWPQVHASRGCCHDCSYCSVIAHFGRKIRKQTPEHVIKDIKESIAFHQGKFTLRFNKCLWITDDNFAEDRQWAISVLKLIIENKIDAYFSVQARFEIGFDDEILGLMKEANFFELAIGIEFLDDDDFSEYNKKSNYSDIKTSVANIQKYGLAVRGLFIVGTDRDTIGVGTKIADYVIDNNLHGSLVQSMFFVPGTPVYADAQATLIHTDWQKYCGNVVHYPKMISPAALQREIINASAKIYSFKRLVNALIHYKWLNKMLFVGEFLWQITFRKQLFKELLELKKLDNII